VSRTDTERVRDILESIEAIDRAEATVRRYPGDADIAEVALDAVQRRVFTIGEAVKPLSPDLRQRHPGVPWSDIARMRDLIGHHYYKLDSEIVRATIGEPVEALRVVCRAILAESAQQDEVQDGP
jgi:uncharacterized protein with HEPN domain